MLKPVAVAAALFFAAPVILAQASAPSTAFEVATIKPVSPDAKTGRYITMLGNNCFVTKYYTLKRRGSSSVKRCAEPAVFTAIEQQIGLRIEATRGVVQAMVVDKAELPTPD